MWNVKLGRNWNEPLCVLYHIIYCYDALALAEAVEGKCVLGGSKIHTCMDSTAWIAVPPVMWLILWQGSLYQYHLQVNHQGVWSIWRPRAVAMACRAYPPRPAGRCATRWELICLACMEVRAVVTVLMVNLAMCISAERKHKWNMTLILSIMHHYILW